MIQGAGEDYDSFYKEKKQRLIERFLNAETVLRNAEARYGEFSHENDLTPMGKMAYEAVLDARDQLEKAFEEMINVTELCMNKLRDESDLLAENSSL